ncbi:MAG: S9 family peptidase [Acidimicrobiales bacterium]|nr:S9 family peptidase [Acidimicrobiales bacterium]MCB9394986.1 S9 family peptidase [Acidimicrobiaceae bacterium]
MSDQLLPPPPPAAKQVPHTWQRPTGPSEDPWAWLRDRDDPDTVAYLAAENAYAAAWLAPHEGTVEAVFQEIKARVQETDSAVPVRKGAWWYTTRTVEGLDYAIHCRGASPETAEAHVLLDENVEARGHDFFSLGLFDVDPSHTIAAWSSDVDGSERYTLRFRDLASGTDLPDELVGTSAWGGGAWSADGRDYLYMMPDDQMRPFQVWRHRLGTSQADDVLVLHEEDERFYLGVDLTRSERWIVFEASSKTTSEAWVLPAGAVDAEPTSVRHRTDGVEYTVDDWGDRFVVLTNLDAEDFRVMSASHEDPSAWTEMLPHVSGQRISAVEPFASHLVVHEWSAAQQRIRIVSRDTSIATLDLGTEPHELELDANPEWQTTTLRYAYQSFTTPASVYELDLPSGTHTLLKRTPTPNVDTSQYEASREWATAPDGTLVPVDVVRRRGVVADGTAPCMVYGYGSYEASMPPWFSVARLSLLDRGWTWALVHPRGGGELGRRWYTDGKLLHKRNTFDDTIACVEHLRRAGWARADGVVLRGGSAGGLLVGACVTMRPELFCSVIAEVPFVDVVTTMSDPSLPLTVTEWEEWGDPRTEPFASYILGYSPYDNTGPRDYPATLITAGLNDPRVSYHEPAKWCAKLRAVRTDGRPQLMRTEMGAGHAGPSGRYERWRDEAIVLTFALATVER